MYTNIAPGPYAWNACTEYSVESRIRLVTVRVLASRATHAHRLLEDSVPLTADYLMRFCPWERGEHQVGKGAPPSDPAPS